jgi:hypothetical protein
MKALLGIFFLLSNALAAQQHIAHVTVWKPKSGLESKFENGYKQHLAFHKSMHDTWNWYGWYVISGPRDGYFVDATFGHTWSDFDTTRFRAQDDADNALHTAPFGDFLYRYKMEQVPELSTTDAATLNARILRVVTLSVSNVPTALKLVEKLRLHYATAGSVKGFQTYRMIDGGELNQVVLLIGCNSFKEYGNTARLQDEIATIETSLKIKVITAIHAETLLYKPDMSLFP